MQNIVVVANIAKKSLIPKVEIDHYENAIKDLLSGVNLERNLKLFSEMFI
jgi:indolepyruvate ferredoxin oxidoreductase beta subunit